MQPDIEDMTLVSLCFEVHQPIRLKKNFFWDSSPLKEVVPNLREFYFDDSENRRIFERVSDKCYLPANQVILESIRKHEGSDRPFKVAYSFSGIFLEQCRAYRPEVLDSFVKLVETGGVEVMEQTYYHSLASLYEDKAEFFEQVRMHKELIWDIFGLHPTTFENTELIYNDEIAGMVEGMGYKAVFTEGVVADPNYVYRPPKTGISLLLRNYKLTDDIGFRFSSHNWEEYPLTADKYASWLAATPGQCINIFCDYETFGEHQWADTGIFEFLRVLPEEVLRHENLRFATPAEIAERSLLRKESYPCQIMSPGRIWRGIRAAGWEMPCSRPASSTKRGWRPRSRRAGTQSFCRFGGRFCLSDHLYYIFTHGGGPGEVHSYFSPYGIPYDASVTYFSVLCDLHYRLKMKTHLADSPFRFATDMDQFTGEVAWSLAGLQNILKTVSLDSLQYHNSRGDLALWAATSLADAALARAVWPNQRASRGRDCEKACYRQWMPPSRRENDD